MNKICIALSVLTVFVLASCNSTNDTVSNDTEMAQPDKDLITEKEDAIELQDEIFASAFEMYPDIISETTRGETDAETDMDRIMNKYRAEKYEEALPEFNQYIENNPEEMEARFYRGIINLKHRNGSQAVADLKMVTDQNDLFHDEAEWYLGLAYLVNKQKKEAANLIFLIGDSEDHKYKDNANTIVNTFAYKKYLSEAIESI